MSETAVVRAEAMEPMSAAQVVQQVKTIQEVMRDVMKDGSHYGTIPGCGDKPSLFKSGAEKLALVFHLAPTFTIDRRDLPVGHVEFSVTCTMAHAPTGRILGSGVGSCSTMESKYRYRGAAAVDTGQPVPKDYWNAKKINAASAQEMIGGKGFAAKKNTEGVWTIHQTTGERQENPDIADTYNTVLKMAKKRAQVDATLTVTAASDIFTQDIEDLYGKGDPSMVETRTAKQEPPTDVEGDWYDAAPKEEPITTEQLKAIRALALKKNITGPMMTAYFADKYNGKKSGQLTSKEGAEVIQYLTDCPEEPKQ